MRWFFASLPSRVRSLGDVTIGHIDTYLEAEARRGWSRGSLHALGSSIRSFFRYAAQQGWCSSSVALGIDLPRLYALGDVPRAPTIDEVNKLLEASSAGNDLVTIRDHAILSLLIHYGLRRGEVERLTLDDIDWIAETLHVMRPKLRRPQCYPLWAPVGEAILRYLRQARPRCAQRAVFLTMKAPHRPLSGASISAMVAMRLTRAGREAEPGRRPLSAPCLRGPAHGCWLHLEADRRPSRPSQHEQHPHLYEDRHAGPASGGGVGPGGVAMSTTSTIAAYIQHNRNLGKRFVAEEAILLAFSRSVGKAPLHGIHPAMITRFVNRDGASVETIARKRRVLVGFFRYAVTRCGLEASPMPSFERKRGAASFTPYIFSEAELKRLLAAAPAASGPRSEIDADTLRTFVLLLYGAGLRRGEARRLKVSDVDLPRSLLHIRGTKFFKTRIVPISARLSAVLKAFVASPAHRETAVSLLFCKCDGTPLTNSAIGAAFRRLREIADIKRDGGARNQPRLHDLRHTAAVHRVTSWYRVGADLNDLLPKLATYLGHKDLSGTQRYLTMTEELLAEASRRFEAFAQGGRHD